jgi:hypothetical protein
VHALVQHDTSRLILPAELAKTAGWAAVPKDFQCYGYFRSAGELLCAPAMAKAPNGDHPFGEFIHTIATPGESRTLSINDLPDAATVAMQYRFRTFTASWVGTKQVNLKLGSAYLSLLGWIAEDRPPIYPVALPQIICLYSHSKIQEIHRLGTVDF